MESNIAGGEDVVSTVSSPVVISREKSEVSKVLSPVVLSSSGSGEEVKTVCVENEKSQQGIDVLENVNDSVTCEDDEDDGHSILAMRKNLTATFDKHAQERARNEGKKGFRNEQRPPVAPHRQQETIQAESNKMNRKKRSSSSLLSVESLDSLDSSISLSSTNSRSERLFSVYLRIRPPSTGSYCTGDTTIEIIFDDASTRQDSTQYASMHQSIARRVRTHPPVASHAFKSIRQSQDLQQHGSSDDKNIIVNGIKEFKFNRVFGPNACQEDVYNCVAAPLVVGLFPTVDANTINGDENRSRVRHIGQSALIFAYGITNAGKTYTIMGKAGAVKDEQKGLLPRALRDILAEIERRGVQIKSKAEMYGLQMSFFEIYNEQIYDLLEVRKDLSRNSSLNSSSQKPPHQPFASKRSNDLKLREDRNGNIFVQGLSKHLVDSVAHGVDLALAGKKRRQTSSNNLNGESSRSHCICQLEVVRRQGDHGEKDLQKDCHVSTFWIVDLAGSERAKRTELVHGSKRQREAVQINTSLMNLMRCLQQLHQNQNNHSNMSSGNRASARGVVPFRGSKLSHLFMNHFTGSSGGRTVMMVNVNPIPADFDETQHVLSYAAVARNVKVTAREYCQRVEGSSVALLEDVSIAGKDSKAPTKSRNKEDKIKNRKRGTSPPRKIAKIATKLSPRAVFAKKKEINARKRTQTQTRKKDTSGNDSEREKTQNRKTDTSGNDSEREGKEQPRGGKRDAQRKVRNYVPQRSQRDQMLEKIKKQEQENKRLSDLVSSLRTQVSRLQSQSTSLKEELVRQESKIRVEVGEEWEEQMQIMRQFYEDARKQQQQRSEPTISRSAKKIRLEKAEEQIDELWDKLDECEEEMDRMRKSHAKEMEKTKFLHETTLASKEKELQSLITLHQETILAKDKEIQQMKEDTDAMRDQFSATVNGDDGANCNMHENEKEREPDEGSVGGHDGEKGGMIDENPGQDLLEDKENGQVFCDEKDPHAAQSNSRSLEELSPRKVRILPRRRCSEVACALKSSPPPCKTATPALFSKQKRCSFPSVDTGMNIAESQQDDARVPLLTVCPLSDNIMRDG